MCRVSFTHKAQIRCVMSQFLDDFCHALHFVVTHACATFCRTYYVPLPDKPQKVRKTGFLCRDFKKEKWDRFGANPINWIWSCALRSFLLPQSSEHRSKNLLKVNSWYPMEIPRLYLLVPGKCYDLGPGKWTKDLEWNFQKPFSRESCFATATRFSLQNGYTNTFCSDPHWLLIQHRNPQSIL